MRQEESKKESRCVRRKDRRFKYLCTSGKSQKELSESVQDGRTGELSTDAQVEKAKKN